jgi:hypothetical protein
MENPDLKQKKQEKKHKKENEEKKQEYKDFFLYFIIAHYNKTSLEIECLEKKHAKDLEVVKNDSQELEPEINVYYTIYKLKVTPSSGTYHTQTYITMTANEGEHIYYTWDGTVPTSDSAEYVEPIAIPEGNQILSVIVVNEHGMSSNVLKMNYQYLP